MTRLSRSLAIPALSAGLVLFGACSASTSSATKTSTKDNKSTTTVGKKAGQSTTTAGGMSTTTVTTVTSDTTATTGGGGPVSGSFCELDKQATAKSDEVFAPPTGTDQAANLEKLKKGWAELIDIIEQIKAVAPAEIKADVDFLAAQQEKINVEIQKLKSLDQADMTSLGKRAGVEFNTPEADEHNSRITTYEKDKCGIDN